MDDPANLISDVLEEEGYPRVKKKKKELTWYGKWREKVGPYLYSVQDRFSSLTGYTLEVVRKFKPIEPIYKFQLQIPTGGPKTVKDARKLCAVWILQDAVWNFTFLFPLVEGYLTEHEGLPKEREPLSWPSLFYAPLFPTSYRVGRYSRKSLDLSPQVRSVRWCNTPRVAIVDGRVLAPKIDCPINENMKTQKLFLEWFVRGYAEEIIIDSTNARLNLRGKYVDPFHVDENGQPKTLPFACGLKPLPLLIDKFLSGYLSFVADNQVNEELRDIAKTINEMRLIS